MQLTIKWTHPGTADGFYTVKAKGCIMASLCWADERGILEDWTAFAYVPISAGGMGTFHYIGSRAVPEEASCVIAKGISADFLEICECTAELPEQPAQIKEKNVISLAVMSDLHIANKPGRLVRALQQIQKMGPDALLLPGDLVNDGRAEQFSLLLQCLKENNAEVPLFCAAGNHDYPLRPIPQATGGVCDYQSFQSWILKRNQTLGYSVEEDKSGACALQLKGIDVIALNAVTHWRKFIFREGAQLEWLKHHLDNNQSDWHIILCHAPLWSHNPQRRFGYKEPYLSRDSQLQEILDTHRNVIFISGHTHVSPNIPWGCVEFDDDRRNIYINDGSLCPNELKESEALQPKEWADGTIMELAIGSGQIQITSRLLNGGRKIARGYYSYKLSVTEHGVNSNSLAADV